MKKILILAYSFFLMNSISLFAQSSMTDSQVMDFVVKENAEGTSREDIVKKLMRNGVTAEQLQRIRSKYEREHGKNQVGTRGLLDKQGQQRLRVNNGDKRENRTLSYRKGNLRSIDSRHLSAGQVADLETERQSDFHNEFDALFPDSTALYNEIMYGEREQAIPVFGRNIFNKKNLNFEPEMNISTPEDYRIGPGDVVYIDVWGASQKSFQSTVSADGEIEVEGFGPVSLSGLTVAKANQELRRTLGKYYVDSNVKLTIGQTKAITVNVMGEVAVPGTYNLSAFATVFHALYMAGGTNHIGTLRDIKVYRKNKLIATVDIYDYILHGNLKGNVRLASGDVIIVGPYNSLVNISGKVKRPMYYEMRNNESLGTLIDYAGGFRGDAYQKTLRLIRKQGGVISVYSIDEFDRHQFQLCDGDSVYVDSVLNRYSNMIDVRGAVFRPGLYQMDGKVTTVRAALEQAGGLTEDAFGERVIMHRRNPDRTLKVLSFNAKALMAHEIPDISLQNEDVIFVTSKKELHEKRTLLVSGEVLYPGTYDYAENTSLEDLILQAGGLTDAASIVKVDVSRRVVNKKATQPDSVVAKSYSFSLKDGFVVDGQPGFILKPYDEVFVRRSPGYVEQEHVSIHGEVAFSGEYVLTRKNRRLSDLVKAAGGLTAAAYSKGARLERLLTPEEKLKQQTLLKLATMGDSVDIRKLDLGNTRHVGINLDMALLHPGNENWDIVLQKGDKLIIPQFNNTVSISGEVMYPNTVIYKKGMKLKYYINQAGGYNTRAKTSKVFAVNMNGTVTRVKSAKDILPGCEIVVPSKAKKKGISLTEIMGIGTLTASMATVIATLVK